jgi:hypothetical protein
MAKVTSEHPIVRRALPENVPAGQGFVRCESHDIPMIYSDDGEWVCAIEFLMDCLAESQLVGFEFKPIPDDDDDALTLSLVFDDGHVVPLLCADCGNAVEDDDEEITRVREQIEALENRTITDIEIGDYPDAPYPWLSTIFTLEVGGTPIDAEFPLLSMYYMTHPGDDADEALDDVPWESLN